MRLHSPLHKRNLIVSGKDHREAVFLRGPTSSRMSAIGTKRTSACALHISAFDSKRIWLQPQAA
jgi:hypothetical protein